MTFFIGINSYPNKPRLNNLSTLFNQNNNNKIFFQTK